MKEDINDGIEKELEEKIKFDQLNLILKKSQIGF